MIEARALGKSYQENDRKVTVFRNLNLRCEDGEFTALMGPSGAGKTSLLQLLGCLDRPTEGHYFLDGVEVSAMEEEALAAIRNQKIGFIFQTSYFVEYLDLVENVALPGFYSSDLQPADCRARARSLLQQVGLAHRLDHLPKELSGGERQRVAIARSLFNSPKLILADEPTGNLDKASTDRILDLLQALRRDNITLLLVTHDDYVATHADRLLSLTEGTLLEQTG